MERNGSEPPFTIHTSIVCPRCGDSTLHRCALRGCPVGTARAAALSGVEDTCVCARTDDGDGGRLNRVTYPSCPVHGGEVTGVAPTTALPGERA